MATYAIGDVQGCFEPLMQLLKAIDFKPQHDSLIFCGDLVNRGGRSLDVLRWVYAHQHCCEAVLGNHDLSMLSKYHVGKRVTNKEFKAIFNAPDAALLIAWLLHRPLFLEWQDKLITHAGLYPWWSVKKLKKRAIKTQQLLTADPHDFFSYMYGNSPKKWHKELSREAKARFTVNALTRMRFVKADGSLNFTENRRQTQVKGLKPWFEYPTKETLTKHVIFGHWSALGLYQSSHVTCLDTGKVWGGQLTALCLEDDRIFSV